MAAAERRAQSVCSQGPLIAFGGTRVHSLASRLREKNNAFVKSYAQMPLMADDAMGGSVCDYPAPSLQIVSGRGSYRWDYLVHHYHYLSLPKLVGEHLKYEVSINAQIAACLGWASAAWKIRDRDTFIGWDEQTKRKNLYLVANNVRFLILPWVQVEHLASKILALSLKRLSSDWQAIFGHPVYLAETFVDTSRYPGTCYRASNWLHVGQTGTPIFTMVNPRRSIFIPFIESSGGCFAMTRDEAFGILDMERERGR